MTEPKKLQVVLEYLQGSHQGVRFITPANHGKDYDYSKYNKIVTYKVIGVTDSNDQAHKWCDETHDVNVQAYLDSQPDTGALGKDMKKMSRELLDKDLLERSQITIQTTNLGETLFIPLENKDERFAHKKINPAEWSISQLRAMANYMERHRDMTKFDDGSGDLVKL